MVHRKTVGVCFAVLLLLSAPIAAALTAVASKAQKNKAQGKRAPSLLLRQFMQSSRSVDAVAAAPLPNDTITQAYWLKVDQAIANAQTTTEPVVGNTPPPDYSATRQGADITAQDLTPEEIAAGQVVGGVTTSLSPSLAAARVLGHQSLVSYDMALGARLMYGLTAKPTPKIPEQRSVSQQLVAQCPMVMFANTLQISAPRCGDTMGQWLDPSTSRTILRWSSQERGTVHFGVDSVITGMGSATYAELSQELSLQGIYFNLMNCLKLVRYTIAEEIVKINAMGPVSSSTQEHDNSKLTPAYFYKYKIISPNGTAVAETGLFRANQNELNVTMYDDEVSMGPTVATARRVGSWTQSQWRQCTPTPRAWEVEFLMSERDFDQVATVMDLRIATAAAITLMAFRAETQSAITGAPSRDSTASLFKSVLYVLLAIGIFVIAVCTFSYMGWARRMRRCCFKLEAICLPRRPALKRAPTFNPTY
jgi:hypothetical protein